MSSTKKTPEKKLAFELYRDHVSSGKAAFFEKYGMDFIMGRREGPYLWDMDGKKRLINCHCNGGVFNLGHRQQELSELLKQSLDSLDIGNHHLISRHRAELAHELALSMPEGLEVTVFGVSGGEAVDLAIKVARAFTGKTRIISALGGYHGHTGLAMAAGDAHYREPFGPTAADFSQVPFGDLPAFESATDNNTAAVILETIPATLGMVVPDSAYLEGVRQICSKKGVLLILDEIQSGLGRTGKLWAFEHFSIIPDIVVLGKGLSGGIYPISATVMKKELESVFQSDPFIHISTFGGSELGCVIARRVLEISSSQSFLTHVNTLSEHFTQGIETLRQQHTKFLKGQNGKGLMLGLKLDEEISGPVLTKTAYDQNLLLIYANNDPSVCQFLPPLILELTEAENILDFLDRAFAAARKLKPFAKIKRYSK